ncbi:DUF2087 domain-containing protein [Fundidesulfovibrio soli]|uniref:DUF2087 domain-containing protein n=1 Tax=Fundidesulfovibrio soli TaxID=2922716 RepID=UPI001FB04387|nr:DUF2087 domain-containing protein [Fundidesulfovibrio soli]
MSRIPMPFHAEDIGACARSLRSQLQQAETTPSHLELMNMLARAAGFRNFQHYRANCVARLRLAQPVFQPEEPAVDYVRVRRMSRYFDAQGRLIRWPGKFSHREPCLWVIWSRLTPGAVLNEAGINEALAALHLFEDHALLRRQLCDLRMVERSRDCREYRRIERRPSPEALELIRQVRTVTTSTAS